MIGVAIRVGRLVVSSVRLCLGILTLVCRMSGLMTAKVVLLVVSCVFVPMR